MSLFEGMKRFTVKTTVEVMAFDEEMARDKVSDTLWSDEDLAIQTVEITEVK